MTSDADRRALPEECPAPCKTPDMCREEEGCLLGYGVPLFESEEERAAFVAAAKGRCTCMAEGEDPHCPDHGYEAVIRRLNAALEEVHDFAANEVSGKEVSGKEATWIMARVERAFKSPPHAFDEPEEREVPGV